MPSVMHCRLQERISLTDLHDPPDLSPFEAKLLDRVRELSAGPNAGEVGIESVYAGLSRASAQRTLRQLEGKGAVRRLWRLLPPSGKPRVMRGVKPTPAAATVFSSLTPKQADAALLISQIGKEVSYVELAQKYGVSRSTVDSLQKKGLVEAATVVFRRAPAFVRLQEERYALHDDQDAAVREINSAIDTNAHQGFLLHGVTASGKTEVYIRCAEHALSLCRTCLVLLPEIAITTQVMNIFKSRFGDQVAVLHSALSAGERCDEWGRIQDGEAVVMDLNGVIQQATFPGC